MKFFKTSPKISQKAMRDITSWHNPNALCPDPRNNKIMFEVQKFISKTNRFSKHYD